MTTKGAAEKGEHVRSYFTYIMASRRNGTLYVGVTGDLARRVWQHREGEAGGFTRRYGVGMLVWYEVHTDVRVAIQREKNLKHWPRRWKVAAIEAMNPEWRDLYEDLNR